ncbi:MAG: RlmE family RNA methyltransferase [Thermoplasmata archaeon]|nr:RlmE family RNA methyltransferase [Thermoplasmata archaeon]
MTKQWRSNRKRDKYYRKAKREHYRSRAVYKLKQLDYKYDIIRQGDVIVDLGASPGGWSQVALELGGPESRIFAVDLDRMAPIEGVTFIRGDIRDQDIVDRLREMVPDGVDAVISDMSPDISGNYSYDHARSIELCEHALRFGDKVLKEGGNFLCKMFYGDMSGGFVRKVKPLFSEVHLDHPKASRASSSEVYVVALEYRLG